ncbi:MAG: 6-bladed beta-propeller [Planctomycetota bacterium]|jgi:DNA-binding beta-propeller fold protein YncE
MMILLFSTIGCSQSAVDILSPPEPPIVWPKSPDAPRIRYLGELTGSQDVRARKSMSQFWNELFHGPTPPKRLTSPYAVAVNAHGNRVAIADTNGACVHVFDLEKQTYDQKVNCGQPFECPVAVAWANDSLWVADSRLHALAIFDRDGKTRTIGSEMLKRPAGLAYCPANDLCYVTDAGAHAVLAFDKNGRLLRQFGSRGVGLGQFNGPSHVACDADNCLLVVDSLNFRVQKFGLDGTSHGIFGQKGDAAGDFALPKGVAVAPDGNIWVVDAHFENIQGFTPEGKLLMAFGTEGQKPGEFWLPAGICIDTYRRMWVADCYNRRVQVFELLQ